MAINIIGIAGIGVLGTAISNVFESFNDDELKIVKYDKYKNIGDIDKLLQTDVIFLCLPTELDVDTGIYNITEIENMCEYLNANRYRGIVVLKSTVLPYTTQNLSITYSRLLLVHNPEFLSERTAEQDFRNQKHIVIGLLDTTPQYTSECVVKLFNKYFPSAELSICMSYESESMKIFCNTFYAVKVHFMTELKLLCDSMSMNYSRIKDLMIRNGWINPKHTDSPGHDGFLSYGGRCLPKDSGALLKLMEKYKTPRNVLDATVKENKEVRGELGRSHSV
jgi:UDPglucose 6-dehydrogenase